MRKWTAAAIVLWVMASIAGAQEWRRPQFGGPRPQDRQRTATLSIEEQRKLGLSDAQIQKIAEARSGLERERAKAPTRRWPPPTLRRRSSGARSATSQA